MKYHLCILAALLCACSPERPDSLAASSNLIRMTFTASGEASTKTSLTSSYGIKWSTADAVTLFASAGTAGSEFKVSSTEENGAVATFTGLSPESSTGYYYALYPASKSARLEDASGAVSTEIPTVQTGVENSFAVGANVSLARVDANATASNDILHFKNAGALLSFLIPGNYITRVRIESLDQNVPMTGPATVSYNNGNPTVTPGSDTKNYVDVLVPEGTWGKRYYAVVYPGNYSGFRVSFITSMAYYNRYTSSKPLALHRNDNIRLIEKDWINNDDRATSETGYISTTDPVSISVSSTVENYYNLIVNYSITGVQSTGVEHGLVFSYSNATPTCGAVGAEGKLPGPVLGSTGSVSLSQCIPNACLKVGQPCYVRAYCFDNAAGSYAYSPVQELTLKQQPEGFSISKTAKESPASGIGLYSFTAGGSYNGFVAEADCSSSSAIRLGVNNAQMGTTSAISMASQRSSCNALVLINGQIFGGQGNIGLAYTGGVLKYNNSSDDGISACSSYGNDYSSWQPVTRAILGVDASGKPGAYWCTLIGGKAYFFNRPIPAGSAKYPQVTASSGPGPAQSWSPAEALSTGPMLVYDGKICVSEDKISTGVYYTNYELWSTKSGDIYGSSRNRTAIGYDASGKMYLVVVTSNITLTGMARVMKGLGCTYAMNLDGGGSVQMEVKGTGSLTSNVRNVKSTVGFFNR
ncbi:MAG: phosphodiester glycosidase family protein [Bacteroidales bacterium]|nr:phosphodiester glycosidase family protein [Bacteroidales bacterium]